MLDESRLVGAFDIFSHPFGLKNREQESRFFCRRSYREMVHKSKRPRRDDIDTCWLHGSMQNKGEFSIPIGQKVYLDLKEDTFIVFEDFQFSESNYLESSFELGFLKM